MKLTGWIVRKSRPIEMDEWIDFARQHKNLVQVRPVSAINPFTREPMEVQAPYSFDVRADDEEVGRMSWGESEVVFVNGRHEIVDGVVADACAALNAEFEAYDESQQ
jgi:hypothetical protein